MIEEGGTKTSADLELDPVAFTHRPDSTHSMQG